MSKSEKRIAVIGLGYVGLPLAVEFAKKYRTTGFDISTQRIKELGQLVDRTLEISSEKLSNAISDNGMLLTSDIESLRDFNVYVVTVPTPVDKNRNPDITPLLKASESIGKVLKIGDLVIYESTVYPGATEEDCVPVLERVSGLQFNKDFFCGYSPERINPGDKTHTVTKILKVTSGSTPEVALIVDELYASIIEAGTHLAPSIKVAEAAKVIENTQRDINIAFVNELAMIFNKMGIDTRAVLEAASTKWNFLPFKPGLVGGHCIGVDPYYLTHKAREIGFNPEIVLAGRRVNDNMGAYIAGQIIKLMIKKGQKVEGARVIVLGITFKEDCPDIRNSKVVDVINELRDFGTIVDVHDPWANPDEVYEEYGIQLIPSVSKVDLLPYQAVVFAVAHKELINLEITINSEQVVYDVKGILPEADGRL